MDSNTKVGCKVGDCKHCNLVDNFCMLDEIDVCHCSDGKEKQSTMCNNYECK